MIIGAKSKFLKEKSYSEKLSFVAASHFYHLIVHNTSSCPSLMLASFEPETQKSNTRAGWKTVSDPLQFYNIQTSATAVLVQQ